MAFAVSCPDCKARFTAFNQWLVSIAFDAHECEKHKPVIMPICPMLKSPKDSDGQRNISVISTMEIFEHVKKDAAYAKPFSESITFDDELWEHLESRLKYLLNHAGLR